MEKLIYIHVLRLGESLYESDDVDSGYRDATNDWYLLKQTDGNNGVEIQFSRVFEDINQVNHPGPALVGADCAVIGSFIYVIGGRSNLTEIYLVRCGKELPSVDLPRSFWFGREEDVELIVLAKDRFCVIWHDDGYDVNEICIYYTGFSVSYDLPKPTATVEDSRAFPIRGVEILNIVTLHGSTPVPKYLISVRNQKWLANWYYILALGMHRGVNVQMSKIAIEMASATLVPFSLFMSIVVHVYRDPHSDAMANDLSCNSGVDN
ncbi:hypothetical protein GH714_023561 [Hevea brasiliensis]|uniref:Uncharacterized protein n=1 Tax=Hevea brasiliensis TaxID=3981 RepID=A0A6A6LAF6_HEVBR|nr:hypothetical protein GH714_023561 [Hevea brasiliensis]